MWLIIFPRIEAPASISTITSDPRPVFQARLILVHPHYDELAVTLCKKGKGFPYSTPSVGPRADPGVQAVSLQVTVSHPPSGRLPLLSARPAVTSPAAEHHRPLAGTKLY